MELKSYEFTRAIVYQGKFGSKPGDTLMQTGPEQFVFSGSRGTVEVMLREKTIATYLREGYIKEIGGMDEPGEEPKAAAPPPEPKVEAPLIDTTARIIPVNPIPMEVAPVVSFDPPPPVKVTPKKAEPKSTPKPGPKKADAPKPTPKPAAKVATKDVVQAKPEKVSPILEAALGEDHHDTDGIDAVLSRTKKVVRKNR